MQEYLINDLERLTGIKAHTIRIWEKRYNLIEPERSVTNRRSYSDAQVRKLLNVTTLLSHGHKISKIASFSDEQIHEQIEIENSKDSVDVTATGYVNDLISTMLAFDEPGFEKIFSGAVLRYGLFNTMLKVVYPFLAKTGILWTINKASPIQEHFASCILIRKLQASIDGLLPPSKRDSKFLLFLPNEEWHEIGLLFANYIIRAQGFETVYLGQNVPEENIVSIIETAKPDYLLFFYVAQRPVEIIEKQIKTFLNAGPEMQLLVSCSSELFKGEKTILQHITYLKDAQVLIDLINSLH